MIYDADMILHAAARRQVTVTAPDGTTTTATLVAWRPRRDGVRTHTARVAYPFGERTHPLNHYTIEAIK